MNELIALLNKALGMEYAARVQYLTHAEQVRGPESEPIRDRLIEQAGDEADHSEKLRTLISDYLLAVPSMNQDVTKVAQTFNEIISVNVSSENEAIQVYEQILTKLALLKDQLIYFETFDFEIRAILREEQEHITELQRIQP